VRPIFATTLALALALAGIAGPAAPSARAQTLNQQGIARLNADVQTLWAQDGIPMARAAAQAQLQKLVGTVHNVTGGSTATVIAVNSVTIQAPVAPGLTRLDGSCIAGRLPLSGTWTVGASIRVRWKGTIMWIPFDDTFNVGVTVKNLSAAVRADLDSSDPAAPRITGVQPPQVSFALDIQSANAVVQAVQFLNVTLLTPLANEVAKVGAVYLAEKMRLAVSRTPSVMGAGGPALAPVAPTANLEGKILAIEQQTIDTKMPFGTVFEMRYRDAYTGTWEQSLEDPSFTLVPDGFESTGDSTTNTGELLAGIAFRFGATRSPSALARIRTILQSTRVLCTMKGVAGDLNRKIMPMSAYTGGPFKADEYVVRFNGVDYYASDYISRDCYFGMLYGLSHVYDLVDAADVRAEAKAQLEMCLDYLLRNNWTWRRRDGSYGERWQGVLDQQYGYLLAGARMNPGKYAALRDQYAGFADLVWVGAWTAVMDPYYDYYKFELGGGSMHVVLRLEADPVRFQRAYQAIAIQRRFIGHHQNALFNSYYMASDPAARAALGAENANLLTRLLRQPRRKIVTDITADPTIEHTMYSLPIDANQFYAGANMPPVEIAKYPVPVQKRTSGGFAWTLSPYRIKTPYGIQPNARAEGEGYDFTLPYWMSRYYGGIRAPRPVPSATAVAVSVAGATATVAR
jgi:hypothetical protein